MSFLRQSPAIRTSILARGPLSQARSFALASVLRFGNVPPSPYHALFKLEEGPNQYVIDPAQLRRSFLEAQRLAHPDVQASQSSPAAVSSSDLNEAYRTLLSPLKRAEYLLSIRGVNMQETDKLDGEDADHAEFIMEVMDARSELEDAQTEDEIKGVRESNRIRVNDEVQILQEAFAKGDTESALKATIRLRYWEGLETAAKEL